MQGIQRASTALDADDLLRTATLEAGLTDFGAPDVRHPLSILVNSLNREAQLTAAGHAGQHATLLRTLINRLRIQDALNRHPEIRSEAIRGPIVIVGLPRSGTTKLQRMMSTDPSLQKLPLWKILNPAPFPGARGDLPDPRIAYAEGMVDQLRTLYPKFYAAHPMMAQEPDEEVFLMLLTFICSVPMHGTNTPSYRAWMVQQDCGDWYRYLRVLLQYFQWQDGSPAKPWLIKAPWHFRWLRTLFEVFPDALVVHSYRDPTQTIPSLAALFEETRKMSSDLDQPLEIGKLVMEYWGDAVATYVRQRSELNLENRFIDVPYTALLKDALSVIRQIYGAAGLPLTDAVVRGMQAWEAANPQHKHGAHSYALERYGLTTQDIERRFGAYIERHRPGSRRPG